MKEKTGDTSATENTTKGSPLHTLQTIFGYRSFRPFQEEIISRLAAGGDAFLLMPTGGGKSLCFQIPALHRPGVGIVVSPLISLMKDQVDSLQENGVGVQKLGRYGTAFLAAIREDAAAAI